MHVHKSKRDLFGVSQTTAGPVLRSLDLAVARTTDRLSHQTRTYKQTSAKDKK